MLQPKLTKVETISPLKLRLFYETGEVKLFDVAPYATGPWYGQLKDESYFNAVQLLPGGVGIEWPARPRPAACLRPPECGGHCPR